MRRLRRFPSFAVLVLLVVILGGLSGVFPFRQILAADRAVELSERKLSALIEENLRLEALVGALQTPEEIERLAREDFGLVMPGEIGYVSIPVEAAEVAPEITPLDPVDDRPWWKVVWDFVTGRDLVGDE